MVTVHISEEYGYREWKWEGELKSFVEMWNKAQSFGVHCLVPIPTLFPGAILEDGPLSLIIPDYYTHIHEEDDSYIRIKDVVTDWGSTVSLEEK
jgi:hypothetical protein